MGGQGGNKVTRREKGELAFNRIGGVTLRQIQFSFGHFQSDTEMDNRSDSVVGYNKEGQLDKIKGVK